MKINTKQIFLDECNDGLVAIFKNKIKELQSEIKKLNNKRKQKQKGWELLVVPLIEDLKKEVRKFQWYISKITTYDNEKFAKKYINADEIINRINIVETIERYIKLQKAGREYRGLCPFHSDKTPSFFVNKDKKVFHCFGCGSSGNVITFLIKMEGISFKQALCELNNNM